MNRLADQERFYRLIWELRYRLGGYRYLADCSGRMVWPQRGVYFFFESGEYRHDDSQLRVTRIGTHALKAGNKGSFWSRLRTHRGKTGGSRAGGGNHRASIFRWHVGSALLNSGSFPDAEHSTWYQRKADKAALESEHTIEAAVSEYIGKMPFLWLPVEDSPGRASDRGLIERNSIALLSLAGGANRDKPSPWWLGHRATNPKVRSSGLWNVNHVDEHYDPSFLSVLEHYVARA